MKTLLFRGGVIKLVLIHDLLLQLFLLATESVQLIAEWGHRESGGIKASSTPQLYCRVLNLGRRVHVHVDFLLLVVHLLTLHAPLQQRVILLTQQVDLTQEVVVLLFQVAFQSTQQLNAHTRTTLNGAPYRRFIELQRHSPSLPPPPSSRFSLPIKRLTNTFCDFTGCSETLTRSSSFYLAVVVQFGHGQVQALVLLHQRVVASPPLTGLQGRGAQRALELVDALLELFALLRVLQLSLCEPGEESGQRSGAASAATLRFCCSRKHGAAGLLLLGVLVFRLFSFVDGC